MMNIYDKNKKIAIVMNDNEVIKIVSSGIDKKYIIVQCIKGKLVIKRQREKGEKFKIGSDN